MNLARSTLLFGCQGLLFFGCLDLGFGHEAWLGARARGRRDVQQFVRVVVLAPRVRRLAKLLLGLLRRELVPLLKAFVCDRCITLCSCALGIAIFRHFLLLRLSRLEF